VTRTYLEMTTPDALRPELADPGSQRLERVEGCPAHFFRYLYTEVGRQYQWTDRLHWSDERIREYLSGPIWLWLLSVRGAPAGYFELARSEDGAMEIAYFGLLPEFVGQGLGKHMLSRAVEEAWMLGPTRVWLHTCTLDHPSALPNYLKRGFRRVKEEKYMVEQP
jgi:GNAT superfamily N-acetyltransferase